MLYLVDTKNYTFGQTQGVVLSFKPRAERGLRHMQVLPYNWKRLLAGITFCWKLLT